MWRVDGGVDGGRWDQVCDGLGVERVCDSLLTMLDESVRKRVPLHGYDVGRNERMSGNSKAVRRDARTCLDGGVE